MGCGGLFFYFISHCIFVLVAVVVVIILIIVVTVSRVLFDFSTTRSHDQ